ncbi:MAG: dihydroneopterin aldolase [Sutterella sp.]|nr:dihydroneopterin aldolase [Sutterella sp.]
MEFLTLLIYLAALAVLFFRPEKEQLAWRLFVGATAICFVMYFISSWTSLLPFGAY